MGYEHEKSGFTDKYQYRSWLSIEGLGVVEPERGKPIPFNPRWYRAWEAELYRQAVLRTGQKKWNLCRFGSDPDGKLTRGDYRKTLGALRDASRQALDGAGIRKGGRISNDQLAMVYFDFWGQTSYLERVHSWRDGFSLDVIPKDLLRDHFISSFSCKIRGERQSFVEGLEVASDLLDTGEMDAVLLGGLFRFYPTLGFGEALENAAAERQWSGSSGIHDAMIVERAAFVVVTRGRSAMQKCRRRTENRPKQVISIPVPPVHLSASDSRDTPLDRLCKAWQDVSGETSPTVYGGMYPSSQIERIESEAAASIAGGIPYENICQRFGDSGCINPFLALLRLFQQKSTSRPSPVAGLLSIAGSNGDTTVLKILREDAF